MKLALPALLVSAGVLGAQQQLIDFRRDVEPVLRARCHACHGAQMQTNGLRLDQREAALGGSLSGPVIKPGDSAGSPLIQRVSSEKETFRMPPTGPPLTAQEIETLRSWIDQGALWPGGETASPPPPAAAPVKIHWAYRPIDKPRTPSVRNPAWVRNPVDAFVLARLEAEGVTPSAEASRNTLIRRLSLDLTGLPPEPEEVEAFLTDNRPDAYERLVDRLLASPHYGEKWARHWLDLAHYADSDGYEKDRVRPYAWRYRHWVIEALNRDLPFDQFTIEQMAGDLLPDATTEERVATGFFRNTLTNREAGVDREEARFEQVINRTNTFGTVWLGLTVGCAQCHNHKFDPLSQKEYYQLFAFFDGAMETDIDAPVPGEIGPYLKELPEYEKKRTVLLEEYEVPALEAEWEGFLQGALADPGKSHEWDFALTSMKAMLDHAERILQTPPEKRTARQKRGLTEYFISSPGPSIGRDKTKLDGLKELRKKLRALDDAFPSLSEAQLMAADPLYEGTHIRVRGDWRRKGLEVEPGTPSVLPPLPAGGPPTRLTLARWLVSPENPLAARVTVNRIWQELFGRGLVFTSDDFGVQGETPSHPELLDWLAAEFRDQGWSMKRIIRRIVTSATYRQSSHARPELLERDPENELLARQSRLRLPAELVRDSALAASGLLDPRIGGPSVRPPQPKGIAELGYANSVKWEESEGRDRYRRGLYIHFQRTTPYPQLMTFDAPDSNVSCTRRARSNTPLQALNLLNDPVFFEAAEALAWRIEREAAGDFDQRLDRAFQLCLAREPSLGERRRLKEYFDRQTAILEKEGANGAFTAWAGLARVLLNLDEFITRE